MLQSGEIIVILLLALVVLGPKRLPDMARKMGRWTTELRAAAREITRGLQAEVDEIREVGRELKAPMDEVKKPFTEIRDEMSGFGPQGREWKGPKPVSGPTPEDAMRDLEEMNRMAEEETSEGDDGVSGSADRPSASPPPSPGDDISPNASLEEETGAPASPPPSPGGDTADSSDDVSPDERQE